MCRFELCRWIAGCIDSIANLRFFSLPRLASLTRSHRRTNITIHPSSNTQLDYPLQLSSDSTQCCPHCACAHCAAHPRNGAFRRNSAVQLPHLLVHQSLTSHSRDVTWPQAKTSHSESVSDSQTHTRASSGRNQTDQRDASDTSELRISPHIAHHTHTLAPNCFT